MFWESCNLNLEIFKQCLLISVNMWMYQLKEDKIKVTKTVYAKNGSTTTILDHLRLIHGIGKNAALFNDPSQKSCLEVFQEEVRSSLSDKTLSNLLFLNRHFKKFSVIMKGTQG